MRKSTLKTNNGMKTKRICKMALMIAVIITSLSSCKKEIIIAQEVKLFSISAYATPAEAGTVNGYGIFSERQTCTLKATSNEGYNFVNWTKNGEEVSTNAVYSFIVKEAATYCANFEQKP